jgi:hypothetical protein
LELRVFWGSTSLSSVLCGVGIRLFVVVFLLDLSSYYLYCRFFILSFFCYICRFPFICLYCLVSVLSVFYSSSLFLVYNSCLFLLFTTCIIFVISETLLAIRLIILSDFFSLFMTLWEGGLRGKSIINCYLILWE